MKSLNITRPVFSKNPLKNSFSEKRLIRKPSLIYEDPPPLPKKTFHNERICWKKRKLGSLPVLIIVFEGVLGSYSRSNFWTEKKKASLSFRSNYYQGIQKLKQEFYIVLISTYSRPITKDLVNYLDEKQLAFDAIYIQRHRTWHPRHTHNIVSILDDFYIEDKSNTLTISAIGIDTEEISKRESIELIYEQTSSFKKKFLTYFSPTCPKEAPVNILIPHSLLQNKYQSFLDIGNFVIRLKRMSQDFFYTFEMLTTCPKLESSFRDPESICGGCSWPVHRFIFFVKENLKQAKPSTSIGCLRKLKRIIL